MIEASRVIRASVLFAGVLCLDDPARAERPASVQSLEWLMGRWTGTETSRGLELVWTAVPGGLRGTLDQLGAGTKPRTLARYELAPADGGWSLVVQEGNQKHRFRGSIVSREQLRFGRRLSKPGPFVVEMGLEGKHLIVNTLMGPQHGAAVPRRLWFERASPLAPPPP
jgi:hypothetical protein